LEDVVERVRSVAADHILVTGDLTTTALPSEFNAARVALGGLLTDAKRVTVLPGNHDRYTSRSVRLRKFEAAFGEFAPSREYPWIRSLDPETGILGLDPTRSHLSARGFLPPEQLARANSLVASPESRPRRLIVACHYPVAAPPAYQRELALKRLKNESQLCAWLAGVGRHLYCCGHVHAAWAFTPQNLPDQLSLNAGAPLLRDPTGYRLPGFLEIELEGPRVRVVHHAWTGDDWMVVPLCDEPSFFGHASSAASG
jgi:3',5'-cyclic AMP phosphodiesterase CpdA